MRALRLSLALALLAVASRGRAADNKSDTITVLPWTDASFSFAPDSKNLTLQYTQLFGGGKGAGWQVYGKFAAPLDQDSRVASFLSANKLVGGFQAELQIGYDQRARLLATLDQRLTDLKDLQKQLATLPASVANGGLAGFAQRHQLGPTSADAIRYLCHQLTNGAACDATDLRPALPPLEAALCSQWFGANCATEASFLAEAARFQKAHCALGKPEFLADQCFAATYLAEELGLLRQDAAAEAAVGALAKKLKLLMRIYQQTADESKVQALHNEAAQSNAYTDEGQAAALILEHASDFADAVEALLASNALLRRDLLLVSLVPKQHVDRAVVDGGAQSAVQHSLVFNGSFAFDRLSVYRDDVLAAPSSMNKWDLQLGLDYTAYFMGPGIALLGRVGYEGAVTPVTKSLERCTSVGGNATTTGRTCDPNALFFSGADPKLANAAYIRLAFDYQFQPSSKTTQIVPGVELRAGVEGLGAARSLDLRGTLFATPISGSAAARVGVGVDCSFAIDDSLDGSISRGNWTVVPFAFVGATASGLMAR